jgi:hypothetical protein
MMRFAVANPQRRFGLTVGGVFLLAGAVSFTVGSGKLVPYVLPPGVALVVLGLVYPPLLVPVERWWMKLGAAMHVVSSTVIITAVFLLVVVPIGALMRRLGHDPMRRRRGTGETYWITRTADIAPETMKRQF